MKRIRKNTQVRMDAQAGVSSGRDIKSRLISWIERNDRSFRPAFHPVECS